MPHLTLAHHGAFDWLYVVVPVVLVLWWVRRAEARSPPSAREPDGDG